MTNNYYLISPLKGQKYGLKGLDAHSPGQRPGYRKSEIPALKGQKHYPKVICRVHVDNHLNKFGT